MSEYEGKMSEGKVGECPFRGKASGDMKCPHRDLGSIVRFYEQRSTQSLYVFCKLKGVTNEEYINISDGLVLTLQIALL